MYQLKYKHQHFDFLKKISTIVGKNVFPILQTSYLREYYLSRNNKFRSTIDTNLYVKNIKSQNRFSFFNFINTTI